MSGPGGEGSPTLAHPHHAAAHEQHQHAREPHAHAAPPDAPRHVPEHAQHPHLPEHGDEGSRAWRWLGLGLAGAACLAVGAGLAVLVHPGTVVGGPLASAAQVTGEGDGSQPAGPGAAGTVTEPRTQARTASGPRFPADTPVLLFGDSLAVGIADPLAVDWPGRELLVDAVEGRSTTTAAGIMATEAATAPAVWVVSLGTNDAPEDFPAAATSVMDQAGPERCVVWYDVHRAATDTAINAELAALLEQYPNLHLIDWHDLAAAHPEWFSVDDIHPSADGYAQRAEQAVQAVAERCTSG